MVMRSLRFLALAAMLLSLPVFAEGPDLVPVAGLVLDEEGHAIPTACLVLRGRNAPGARSGRVVSADQTGRIRSSSTHRATLMAPGRVAMFLDAAAWQAAKITLPKSPPLTGVVVDPEGHPCPLATVRIQSGRTTITDGLGKFSFVGLPMGQEVRLEAWNDIIVWRKGGVVTAYGTPGGEAVRIVLELP